MSLSTSDNTSAQIPKQIPRNTATPNFSNFGLPSPICKVEPVNSPGDFGAQNSPYSMVHSPMSQQSHQSPIGAGLQYTTLQNVNNTNVYLSPGRTTTPGYVSPVNALPTMSGGSFTLLRNDDSNQSNQDQNGNSFSFTPHISVQLDNSSMDYTTEGTLVTEIANQLMAGFNSNSGTFTTLRNILSTSNGDSSTDTELPFMQNILPDEGLTESGLLNELAGQQLVELANLSVADGN